LKNFFGAFLVLFQVSLGFLGFLKFSTVFLTVRKTEKFLKKPRFQKTVRGLMREKNLELSGVLNQ
jgi:hypothetical protein